MTNQASFKQQRYLDPDVSLTTLANGEIVIESRLALGKPARSLAQLFKQQARLNPDRTWIAERGENQNWNTLSYERADEFSDRFAQWLLNNNFGPNTPIALLSQNSLAHAVIMLAANKAGVPSCSVSVPYSLMDKSFSKLRHVIDTINPRLLYVEQIEPFQPALNAIKAEHHWITSKDQNPSAIQLEEIFGTDSSSDVSESISKLSGDAHARYFFTSGSTGMPKAVVHTHGMQMAYLASMRALYAPEHYFRDADYPIYLGWMPWSHISAGSMTFNDAIMHGGSLYLDAGKPIAGLFAQTIQNLKDVSPTVFGSAPIGFTFLADAMDDDHELRVAFYRRLETIVYGGAAMPNNLVERLNAHSLAATGELVPITSGYGATETQGISLQTWPSNKASLIGLPLPGVKLKLTPNGGKTEVRVKSDSVFTEYLGEAEKSKAYFDDNGYFCVGDAACLVDPDDIKQGLQFDGRISEDFKLLSGTWVSAGNLRSLFLAHFNGLLKDLVVCGENQSYVAVLAWPDDKQLALLSKQDSVKATGAISTPLESSTLLSKLEQCLVDYNRSYPGSSTRVRAITLLLEPPQIEFSEITDKGYINSNAVKSRRADLVAELFEPATKTLPIRIA